MADGVSIEDHPAHFSKDLGGRALARADTPDETDHAHRGSVTRGVAGRNLTGVGSEAGVMVCINEMLFYSFVVAERSADASRATTRGAKG
jgi:hypothetical protein